MLSSSDGSIILAQSVTPSDSNVFSQVTRGIYVGTTGDLNVQFGIKTNGSYANAKFIGVRAGTMLPVRVNMIFDSGTSCQNLLICF